MAEQKNPQAQPELSLSEQTRIRREKLTNLQAEGQNPFVITRFDWDATSQQIKDNFDAMEGKPVKVAGRLMSKRGMGKVSFCDLQDRDGRIQLYARQDEMDEEVYKKFKKFDIGDIVGVEGEAFRTQRGEMSVRAHNITLLSKSLLPLPEKFHGLQDKELRFRQRYVDLMVNPEVKKNFVIRSQFIKFMRNYLDNMGYMEVETPVLNTIAGGAAARPFITHHNTLDIDMYMRIATELPLKRLIVGGMDRVYEIGRIFRNEGMDPKHNPRIHHRGDVSGLRRLPHHDGHCRGHSGRRCQGDQRQLSGGVDGRADRPDSWLAPADHGGRRQGVCGRGLRHHHR